MKEYWAAFRNISLFTIVVLVPTLLMAFVILALIALTGGFASMIGWWVWLAGGPIIFFIFVSTLILVDRLTDTQFVQDLVAGV